MSRPASTNRRLALATIVAGALGLGVGSAVLHGFSSDPPVRALQGVALFGLGLALITGAIVLAIVRLGGWRHGEEEFEQLVARTERLAAGDAEAWDDDWDDEPEEPLVLDEEAFAAEFRAALGELPAVYHSVLEHVEVVSVDHQALGHGPRTRELHGHRRYGAVERLRGDPAGFQLRVLVFRDRLIRDLGHDPDQLRRRLVRVISQELDRRPAHDSGRPA